VHGIITFKRSGVSGIAGSGLLIAGGIGCEPAREKFHYFFPKGFFTIFVPKGFCFYYFDNQNRLGNR
jgi:hypothetical protein